MEEGLGPARARKEQGTAEGWKAAGWKAEGVCVVGGGRTQGWHQLGEAGRAVECGGLME